MIKIGIVLIIISIINIINNRKRYIIVIVSLELLILGISLIFISSSIIFDDMNGILSSLFFLTIGAAESAIGLSIITRTNKY